MAQKKAHEVDAFLAAPPSLVKIILIYGPDRGLVSERAKIFATKTDIPIDDPFSTLKIDAGEIENDPDRLLDEANTISLFGGDRLIWIKNAGAQKGLAQAIKNLIATPPEHCFILIEAGDLKKTATLRTTIETGAGAMALPCFADDTKSLDMLIDTTLDQFKTNMSLEARRFLRENLGGDRLASRNELEKLCLYAMGKDQITMEDVLQSTANVSAITQDAIIDAILLGDLKTFSEDFDRQLAGGTQLFMIISTAQRQFQQLLSLRYSMDTEKKLPHAVVASARPPIFFKRQKIIEKALLHWPLDKIHMALSRLQRATLESRKTASLANEIIRQALLALAVESAKAARRH